MWRWTRAGISVNLGCKGVRDYCANGKGMDKYYEGFIPVRVSVEMKLTATPALKHVKPLDRFVSLAGPEAAPSGLLVCRVESTRYLPNGHKVIPWHEFPM